MSTATRRQRERAAVRDRLLAVALDVLEREGPGALTIRRVAGEVDYTPPIVYQHFSGKESLLLALIEVGYERLLAQQSAAARDETTGEARVMAATRAYVRFAAANPHLYTMMNDTTVDAGERFRAGSRAAAFATATLVGWADENGVVLDDPDEVCEMVWGTVLGIANLGLLGTIGPNRAVRLAERALRAHLLALRHGDGLR